MKKDENGMTLVEILATLILVSLVIALIWTTVMVSMKYNIVETKKVHWQQEANRVIAEIQQFHRKCDSYDLTATNQEIKIEQCIVDGEDQGANQIAYNFHYEVYVHEVDDVSEVDKVVDIKNNSPYPINAKGNNPSYDLTLIVRDSAEENPKVTIESTISRYQYN